MQMCWKNNVFSLPISPTHSIKTPLNLPRQSACCVLVVWHPGGFQALRERGAGGGGGVDACLVNTNTINLNSGTARRLRWGRLTSKATDGL